MKRILLLFLFAGIFLTGCVKNNPDTTEQVKQLQLWTSQEEKFFEALGLEFSSSMNDTEIKINIVKFDTLENMQNLLFSEMAEGKGPDIIYIDGDFVKQHTNKFIPIENDQSLSIKKLQQMFLPIAYQTLVLDQKIFGVPMTIDSLGIFYNKELLEEHIQSASLHTWEDLSKISRLLTQKDKSFERFSLSGAALGRIDNITNGISIIENLLIQTVGDLFSEDGLQATFSDSKGKTSDGNNLFPAQEAISFFTSFSNNSSQNYSWNEFLTQDEINKDFDVFVNKKTALVFGFAKDFKTIKKLINHEKNTISANNIGITLFPQKNKHEHILLGELTALAVPSSSKNPELSWQFLKFASTKENLRALFNVANIPTAHVDLLPEQEASNISIFVRQAKFVKARNIPIAKNMFHQHLSKLIQNLNNGKISINDGLKKLQNTFTNMLVNVRRIKQILLE